MFNTRPAAYIDNSVMQDPHVIQNHISCIKSSIRRAVVVDAALSFPAFYASNDRFEFCLGLLDRSTNVRKVFMRYPSDPVILI